VGISVSHHAEEARNLAGGEDVDNFSDHGEEA
jgi:hypothetical protein